MVINHPSTNSPGRRKSSGTPSCVTFVLEGIRGVYNYGCEAIVRGTTVILRRLWPDAVIIYLTPQPRYDEETLGDLGLRVVAAGAGKDPPWPTRVRRRLCRRLGLAPPGLPPDPHVRGADCVLSIGGDLFTLGPGEEHADCFPVVEHARTLLETGVPLVLWAASVGPFDQNPAARTAFQSLLRRMTLITARESLTQDYLRGLGIGDRTKFAADPAFLMAPREDAARTWINPSRRTLGVNLSPLAGRYLAGSGGLPAFRDVQVRMLARLLETYDVDILLVPHVVSPWDPGDDDLGYLADLLFRLPPRLAGRVRLLPGDLHAPRTKGILGRCEAVITARMHCGVAAISMGVPVLFLSYSPKSVGLCEYVYGTRQWVMPLPSADPTDVVAAVGDLLGRRRQLQRCLADRLPVIRDEALKAAIHLASAMARARNAGGDAFDI